MLLSSFLYDFDVFIYCLRLKTTNSYGGCFFSLKDFIKNVSECNIDVCDCIVAFEVRLGVNVHSMVG